MTRLACLTSPAIVLSICLAICGCSSGGATRQPPAGPKGIVKAKVTCEGKPVTTGILLLQSEAGFAASAKPGSDGVFELQGQFGPELPVGKYNVAISPEPAGQSTVGAKEMPKPPSIAGVPDRFYNPLTSKVTVEVKEGPQDLTIDLK